MLRANLRRSQVIVAFALLVGYSDPASAWAWGRLGHRVISRLAEQHLTDKSKAGIKALLDQGGSIADASTWADTYRSQHRETGPWHYVDVPLDEPAYDSKWSADDPKKDCVVDKVHEFKAVLMDQSQAGRGTEEVLGFLIHFVEDMHMPMHVGENHDRGGNDTQVRYFGLCKTTDNGWGTVPDPDHWETSSKRETRRTL